MPDETYLAISALIITIPCLKILSFLNTYQPTDRNEEYLFMLGLILIFFVGVGATATGTASLATRSRRGNPGSYAVAALATTCASITYTIGRCQPEERAYVIMLYRAILWSWCAIFAEARFGSWHMLVGLLETILR
ncbi:hypothetical protein F5Y15DRAFT_418010 [Xylariaceae sp. FL0016]|nr:hypothetical protein F5Y15DRAFT_418010 [Xylariaceae sp. FL0016]